ncbi:ATP-binding cassette domain-containing protein [Flexivirga sp. B27]
MIEFNGVSKRFGASYAVHDLSCVVAPGQVTGLLGPNGAGKTTSMSIALGLQRPTAGEALIDGASYRGLSAPLRQVGALLDPHAVHPARTASAHLSWVATSNGIASGRVAEVLDIVGLSSVAGRKVGRFSLGMKQRLGIAQALLGDPPVLIFDEPVNGLDPEGIEWIRRFLKTMATEGRTVLISSHLMSEMAMTADHLLVIGKGRLLADSTLSDFVAAHTRNMVIVRSPTAAALAEDVRSAGGRVVVSDERMEVEGLTIEEVGDLAARQRVVLHELRAETASLEDAYLAFTRGSVEFEGAS